VSDIHTHTHTHTHTEREREREREKEREREDCKGEKRLGRKDNQINDRIRQFQILLDTTRSRESNSSAKQVAVMGTPGGRESLR
jgi:hypothetical protein